MFDITWHGISHPSYPLNEILILTYNFTVGLCVYENLIPTLKEKLGMRAFEKFTEKHSLNDNLSAS